MYEMPRISKYAIKGAVVILTHENYFSKEASKEYLSASQYKDFVGSVGMRGCEARALAKINGEWEDEMTTALLVGSYVDAHFEGTLDLFKARYPDIFTKGGELKANFKQANEIISRIERDEYFMKCMSGQKQIIMTGEIFGALWKCKIDSLITDTCIVDLKVMASLTDSKWVKDHGYCSFVEFWGYDIQAAIYQDIVRQNIRKLLPFLIAAASKEKVTDIEVIGFLQPNLRDVLSLIEPNIKRILDIKSGKIKPNRCGGCDYCKHTKVLSGPIHYSRLIQGI